MPETEQNLEQYAQAEAKSEAQAIETPKPQTEDDKEAEAWAAIESMNQSVKLQLGESETVTPELSELPVTPEVPIVPVENTPVEPTPDKEIMSTIERQVNDAHNEVLPVSTNPEPAVESGGNMGGINGGQKEKAQSPELPEPTKPNLLKGDPDNVRKFVKGVSAEVENLPKKMLEIRDLTPDEKWKAASDAALQLESMGVTYTPGVTSTPEQNLETVKNIQSVLHLLPKKSYEGQRFVLSEKGRTDAIAIKPGVSEDYVFDMLTERFGLKRSDIKREKSKDSNKPEGKTEKISSGITYPEKRFGDVIGLSGTNADLNKGKTESKPLDELRTKYVQAKKAFQNADVLSDKTEQEGELIAAKKEYDKARIEFVGGNIENYLKERSELLKSHLAEYGKLDSNLLSSFEGFMKKMGDLNLYELNKKRGKEAKSKLGIILQRSVSVRSLAMAGLGLTSFVLPGAPGVFVAVRAGFGYASSRGVVESLRIARAQRPLSMEELKGNDLGYLEKIQTEIARLRVIGDFDGNMEQVESREDYKALLVREKELLADIAKLPKEEREKILYGQLEVAETARNKAIDKEKRGRRNSRIVGAIGGATIGGMAAKAHAANEALSGAGKTVGGVVKGTDGIRIPGSGVVEHTAEPQPATIIEQGPQPATIIEETPLESHNPLDVPSEKLDFDNLKPAEIVNQAHENVPRLSAQEIAKEEIYLKAIKKAEHHKNISDALKDLLSGKDYKNFMSDSLHLDAKKLNRIQSLRIDEFLRSYSHEEMAPKEMKELKGLYQALVEFMPTVPNDLRRVIGEENIREAVVRMATRKVAA